MKKVIVIFTVLAIVCTSCQNVLTYKNRKYYSEHNTIENNNNFKLCQSIDYRPGIIDGGHAYLFCLTFLNIDSAKVKKVLNLKTDTLIVKSDYSVWSAWDWNEDANYKTKGTIEILQWDEEKIILRENIVIIDYKRKNRKKYVGKRIFYFEKEPTQTRFIKVNKKQDLKELNFNFCDTFSVEITGLYPILNKLPNAQDDSTISKTLLIEKGFTQTHWGRGIWDKGPRFIYLVYEKDDCCCKVIKKYYRIYRKKLRVAERIICNSDIFMDE